ncbi:hypothetical protein G7Z17_g2132 [Cylindrodendrum hubeiense]|uniref:Uncharacterized protein n=1 Tax=Cylindrodendrum hubeiense TaxID=595255 RepID=A0A9P5LLA2_9HYPO|nr:hypothetical protein G7Z17_g2132 [Cylindrodendrum hubeiense]
MMRSEFLSLLMAASVLIVSGLSIPDENKISERQSNMGYTDYLYVHFINEGKNGEQIYFDVSNNNNPGSWTQVNGGQPKLVSTVGTKGVRDPSIVRGRDGKTVWIIATDLHVNANGGVYDTENGSNTAEKFLSGAGMDVTIWRDVPTGVYYRMAKNGPNELIEQTKASSLCTNCWSVVKNQIGSGTIPKGEGPLLFPDNVYSATWHLWIDDYTRARGYSPFETTAIATGAWKPAPSWYQMPKNARHGYVIGITSQERANIVK